MLSHRTQNNHKKRKYENLKDESTEDNLYYIYESKRRNLTANFNFKINENSVNDTNENDSINFALKPENGKKINLFQMCLHFVAKNLEMVDSLVGFPSIVGELLFDECIRIGKFDKNLTISSLVQKYVRLFADAYSDIFIESLTLSTRSASIIATVLPIVSLCNLKELCLRDCNLVKILESKDWNLCDLLKNSENTLEILDLSSNNLNDNFIQKFTLKQRIGLANFSKLSILDLSNNFGIRVENNTINLLLKYANLNCILVSIVKKVNFYDKKIFHDFKNCTCKFKMKLDFSTKGWIKKIPLENFDKQSENNQFSSSSQDYKDFLVHIRSESNNNSERQEIKKVNFLESKLSFYAKPKISDKKENLIMQTSDTDDYFYILKKNCKCFNSNIQNDVKLGLPSLEIKNKKESSNLIKSNNLKNLVIDNEILNLYK
ncbi:unnamed protein product [Brachionus calyciflorus]|uniref:Uncharacterized protein n=1 Tax=Brachionus calyciflorus TaxID=104777 RepID=A0A813M5K4_9BILA|nr:unnamed protein product [Brachionus calyciflorus]